MSEARSFTLREIDVARSQASKGSTATIITTTAAEIDLDPAPLPEAWVIDGAPQTRSKTIFRSRDGTMTLWVWSAMPSRFLWHYAVDEIAHIISGEVFISDDANRERRLGPGDTAYFPAGSCIVWRVTRDVRKVAVCHVPVAKAIGLGLWLWRRLARVLGARWLGDCRGA